MLSATGSSRTRVVRSGLGVVLQDRPVPLGDLEDGRRLGPQPPGGEHAEGRRHVDRRHLLGADGDTAVGLVRIHGGDAEPLGQLGRLLDAHVDDQLHEHRVDRLGHRPGQGGRPEAAVPVVADRRLEAAGGDAGRAGIGLGGRHAGLEGPGQHERLERRTGLAARTATEAAEGQVDLGVLPVGPADQGADVAGLRLDRHQRRLGVLRVGQRLRQDLLGVLLEVGVEGRLDPAGRPGRRGRGRTSSRRAGRCGGSRGSTGSGRRRRAAGRPSAPAGPSRSRPYTSRPGRRHLLRRGQPVLLDPVEHLVAAALGRFGVGAGRVEAGSGQHAGQQGGLRQRQVLWPAS